MELNERVADNYENLLAYHV